MSLLSGDLLRTGRSSEAIVEHSAGFTAEIGPSSTLRVSPIFFEISGAALAKGSVRIKGDLLNKKSAFRVTTPVATAGVRGTAFLVIGAMDGSSAVSVYKGDVSAGIGSDVKFIKPGETSEGTLASGYLDPTAGTIAEGQEMAWRKERERDIKTRAKEVLDELARLQKEEDADWQKIRNEIDAATARAMSGKPGTDDMVFFRRVFDIEDRMSARMLLAIDLRESEGLTTASDAMGERVRVTKVWDSKDSGRRAWINASRGIATPQSATSDAAKRFREAAERKAEETKDEKPAEITSRPETANLFPSSIPGVYLGMTVEELVKARPRAEAGSGSVEMPADIPVVYTEKQVSGGDWSEPGWFTAMYTVLNGRLVQGEFLAFAGADSLRKEMLEKFTGLYGAPARYRVMPDWAQEGVLRGSTVEWLPGNGIEVILSSYVTPTLKGPTKSLGLRIRFSGMSSVLEPPGQFEIRNKAKTDEQLKKDFPEL